MYNLPGIRKSCGNSSFSSLCLEDIKGWFDDVSAVIVRSGFESSILPLASFVPSKISSCSQIQRLSWPAGNDLLVVV